MRRPGGYEVTVSPTGTTEGDTFTCAHCNHVVRVAAKARPEDLGGLCKICMGLECPACVGHGCRPFEEQLKVWEHRDAALRSYGLA